jgi:hypothetical protein
VKAVKGRSEWVESAGKSAEKAVKGQGFDRPFPALSPHFLRNFGSSRFSPAEQGLGVKGWGFHRFDRFHRISVKAINP